MTALRAIGIAMATAVLAASALACGPRTEGLDTSKLPEDLRGDYDIFARRCSKCHSLARPLSAGITDDRQWVDYVNRMRHQPGSGISMDDQAHILRFLEYYAAELRREKAASNPPAPPTASAPLAPAPAPAPADGGAR